MNLTLVTDVITYGFEKQFDDKFREDALYKETFELIKQPKFRINDEIIEEESINRDLSKPLHAYGKLISNGTELDDNPIVGYKQISRLSLDDMLIDLSSNQEQYPFDESKVRLEFEFIEQRKPFKKQKKYKPNSKTIADPKLIDPEDEKNPKFQEAEYVNVRFKYHIYISYDFGENLVYKKNMDDNLDTHDTFKNDLG